MGDDPYRRNYSDIDPYGEENWDDDWDDDWNKIEHFTYKRFIIPVGELTREQAEQEIQQLMSEYHDDVRWDDNLGQITINGRTNFPVSRDYWIPMI